MRHNARSVLGGVMPIWPCRHPSALVVCLEPGWRPPPAPQQGCMQSDIPLHPYTGGTRPEMSDPAHRRPTALYPWRSRVRCEPSALQRRDRTVGMGRTWCVAGVGGKGKPWPALVPLPPSVWRHEGMRLRLNHVVDDVAHVVGTRARIQRRAQTRQLPPWHGRACHGGLCSRSHAAQGWATIPMRSRTHACYSPAPAAAARGGRRAAQQSSPIPHACPAPARCMSAGRPYVAQLGGDTRTCFLTCPSHSHAIQADVRPTTLTRAGACHG